MDEKLLELLPENITEYPNVILRQAGQPLEAFTIFSTMELANEYIKTELAYYGQLIAAKDSENDEKYKYYIIQKNGNAKTLEPISIAGIQDELNKKVDKTTTINKHSLYENIVLTKEDISLDQVENKSSERIRSELTSKNVIDALGYTPLNKDQAYKHPETHPASMITDLADVAISGSYNDLTNKPNIPVVPTNISAFTNDEGYLKSYTEIDPTVPDWAKEPTKPTYTADEVGAVPTSRTVNNKSLSKNISLSASDVGALPSTTVIPDSLSDLADDITHRTVTDAEKKAWNAKSDFSGNYNDLTNKPAIPSVTGLASETHVATSISTHNTNTDAHNDIRVLIEGLTTRLNTLANSTDEDLNQMAEIVDYIKNNKTLIDNVTTSKVNVSDIINNLTTNISNKPLSAAQGVVLKEFIDNLQDEVGRKSALGHTHDYAGSSSAGGSALSAVKLDTSTAGSATQPVYFSGGKPTPCTHTLGKSVPSDAEFTDTTYSAAGSSLGLVKSGGDVTISGGVITVNDDSHNHTIENVVGLQDKLDAKAAKTEGAFFIKGTGVVDSEKKISTWTGESDRITGYYDGLTIRYKIGVAGQSTVTLNINNLGAKTVYRFNTTKLTTHFPVGSIIHLIYHADLNGGCWVTNDYDSNTNTYQRVYPSTNDTEYPITTRYNVTTGADYYAEYGRYSTGVTLNPFNKTVTATAFIGALTGNADTATKATQDANGNIISDTYATQQALLNSLSAIEAKLDQLIGGEA